MSRPILDGPTMSQRDNKKVDATHNETHSQMPTTTKLALLKDECLERTEWLLQ